MTLNSSKMPKALENEKYWALQTNTLSSCIHSSYSPQTCIQSIDIICSCFRHIPQTVHTHTFHSCIDSSHTLSIYSSHTLHTNTLQSQTLHTFQSHTLHTLQTHILHSCTCSRNTLSTPVLYSPRKHNPNTVQVLAHTHHARTHFT